MRTEEVKILLQRYFEGESTDADERRLETYFTGGKVAPEVAEYAEFFGGISELASLADDPTIEEDVMDYILENEHREKARYRSMWKIVTGIAASVIIVLGGFMLYQEQQKSYKDTFSNAGDAYAYATQTLEFVSVKYNKGLSQLAKFEKLHMASDPVKKGTEPVVEFYEELNRIEQQ
jgi:hypothetical protein